MSEEKIKLTNSVKSIIEEAIDVLDKEEKDNRIKICEEFCRIAEQRYTGEQMTYQLNRMHIASTKPILQRIDKYLYDYRGVYG